MKKIYLLAIAAVLTSVSFGQVKWGGQITGNLSSAKLGGDGASLFKSKAIVGFGVGVVSDVTLSEKLSLRSSLNLLQKGVELKSAFEEESGDIEFPSVTLTNKLFYAELPVTLTYNIGSSNGKFFFGAGPSLGYGLFGKAKVTTSDPFNPGEKETESFDAFKKEEKGGAGYKRFDLSANAIAGFQWNSGLYVNAGYLLGLSNLASGAEDGQSVKNRGLQLTVGKFL